MIQTNMADGLATLVHEMWEDSDGCMMVCQAGPDGDAARALLDERARLAWVFEAVSHFDAMTKYHARMGWAPYSTNFACDLEPYPPERIAKQRSALEAELGNRDIIASSRMAVAWRKAAADLGVQFESPFALENSGVVFWCVGWLPDFGGPKGTIIAGRHSLDEALDIADRLGYYTSGLNPYIYEIYDRATFVETLNDWGWFSGAKRAPTWYSGAYHRHGGVE